MGVSPASSPLKVLARPLRRAALAWGGANPALVHTATFVVMFVACGLYSLHRGQDANWDLKNYHYYNAYAYLHDRLNFDIAPAQLQSYYAPLLDLPFYGLVAALNDWPRLVAFAMALPTALALFFLFHILRIAFRGEPEGERYLGIAMLMAVSGAAGIAQWGTTMNEWPVAALAMAAMLIVVHAHSRDTLTWPALLSAGFISGAAAGLKLTSAVSCVALFAALFALDRRIRTLLPFAIATAAGFLITAVPWMLTLYRHFESPLFPYFNNVFRSPWVEATFVVPNPFRPVSLQDALAFPFGLLGKNNLASEPYLRDWHLPIVYIAGLALLAKTLLMRTAGRTSGQHFAPLERFVLIYACVFYVAWLSIFAIYRYVVPLELISGWLLVVLLRRLLPRARLLPLLIVVLVVIWLTKLNPSWGRVPFGERFFDVAAPSLPAGSLVLLTSGQPMAYVAPFFGSAVRFAGVENGLIYPSQPALLGQYTRQAIAHQSGPIFAIDVAGRDNFAVLGAYGLAADRSNCERVASNIDPGGLMLCQVAKR